MWDDKEVSRRDVLQGCYSLSVLLEVRCKGCWWFRNIYSPTNPRCRTALWCIIGDFNVVRFSKEEGEEPGIQTI